LAVVPNDAVVPPHELWWGGVLARVLADGGTTHPGNVRLAQLRTPPQGRLSPRDKPAPAPWTVQDATRFLVRAVGRTSAASGLVHDSERQAVTGYLKRVM
jgi:hypothetical protein